MRGALVLTLALAAGCAATKAESPDGGTAGADAATPVPTPAAGSGAGTPPTDQGAQGDNAGQGGGKSADDSPVAPKAADSQGHGPAATPGQEDSEGKGTPAVGTQPRGKANGHDKAEGHEDKAKGHDNSGHGKASGQNGFRLSLFGYDPAFDHDALVKEGRGRRVFPTAPEKSLRLHKPTCAVPGCG